MNLTIMPQSLKRYVATLLLFFYSVTVHAQKAKVDSLSKLLQAATEDTLRVKYMWQIARDMGVYNPDSALRISQQALYLAINIKYIEGESRSLGILANNFSKIGNYSKALEVYLAKLKLEEKRNSPRNMASALMNIGTVYIFQEEYDKALSYLFKADSLIKLYKIEDLKYYSAVNIGDTYNRMKMSNLAILYFNRSLEEAYKMEDIDLIGSSLTGLGHGYMELGKYDMSRQSYLIGIKNLLEANDDEILCEATLGLAKLYEKLNKNDSAAWYGLISLQTAGKGFLSKHLEAAQFLTDHYRQQKNIDSAFKYVNVVNVLNDSLNSRSRIRELQVISTTEQFRQAEIEEKRKLAEEERMQQLQLLLIAIVIPGLFLLTLVLSRINISIKVIRLLGILSLLFLFEYLTLLLHPTVARLTHHTPVYEIIIFVGIAAILIPLHHKLENWFIHKLLHHRHGHKPAATEAETIENPPAEPNKKVSEETENPDQPKQS
jgi:tetratricopeptide (TPR) repeat protein